MSAYFAILSVPALFALLNDTRNVSGSLLFAAWLIFCAFVGLRWEVGTDWGNYQYIHALVGSGPFSDTLRDTEPASYMLFWLSTYFTGDMLISNVVAAIILLTGIFSFARITPQPWLAILSATPYLIIVIGMTGIRQAMAVGIVLFALARWHRITMLKKVMYLLIASLFHTSALTNVLLILLPMGRNLVTKAIMVIVFGGLAFTVTTSLQFYSDNIEFYQDAYLSNEDSIASPGALMHVALVWLPAALYLLFRHRLDPLIANPRLMHMGSWLSICLLGLYFVSSTGASRMTLYFYFVPMMFYPAATNLLGPRNRLLAITLILAFHFLLLFIWLFFANNAIAHIPYETIFSLSAANE